MDLYATIFELIDMRSFSNLWYWIALASVWSMVNYWVIGLPFDLVRNAARHGGQAMQDLEDMTRINTNRLLHFTGPAGVWVMAVMATFLSSLLILGFWYGVELAQAVFLILFPMVFVGAMSLRTAALIRDQGLSGDSLIKRLNRHRIQTQIIGIVSIFVTSLWGMYQNLSLGALH